MGSAVFALQTITEHASTQPSVSLLLSTPCSTSARHPTYTTTLTPTLLDPLSEVSVPDFSTFCIARHTNLKRRRLLSRKACHLSSLESTSFHFIDTFIKPK